MNQLFASRAVHTFNLLSIGQRGVGKTVFLAGSYAELHPTHQVSFAQKLWFDCQDSQEQEKIEKILNYVSKSGQYPPPTMKITNFNFSLKRQNLWGTQTLCHFRWWDVPGEACNIHNYEFQQLVLNSHGCCVLIDSNALLNDRTYLQPLETMIHQVVAIASLAYQHNLQYSFALVFTKCDLLKADPASLLQFEEKIQPLLARLDAVKANYQRFYSAIPIVSLASPQLKATGADAPLLWLVSQLNKLHYLQPSQQDLASGLKQRLANSSAAATGQKVLSFTFPSRSGGYTTLLASVGVSLLGVSIGLFFGSKSLAPKNAYEQILQRDPENFQALVELANQRAQLQQYDRAIPLIEKLVRREPDRLDLQLNLAQLYQAIGQKQKAETTYDQILVQEKDNLAALVNKAVLRSEQGDREVARTLFVQAEQAAPSSLKAKIRTIAQTALSPTAESTSPESTSVAR